MHSECVTANSDAHQFYDTTFYMQIIDQSENEKEIELENVVVIFHE